METQAPVPPNPGQVVDDPLAPLRLQPLEQISDFWKRYDRLADIHDKTLTSNLNGNLDVLLIFAALFSAINTTFISITMSDLSPSPSDETNTLLRLLVMRADNNTLTAADLSPPFSPNSNSIIVNCLLYASLSCSLLAAVGAMMAKEWLQSFNRSGQTGPLEDQGKFRQRKYNGIEEWHLEAVIKFLPNLLLLSVILFFAGIGLFLFQINTAVAGTVIAFSGLGVVLSGIAIIAGAISPLCPYQSAASNAMRRIFGALAGCWRVFSRNIAPIFRIISITGSRILRIITRLWLRLHRTQPRHRRRAYAMSTTTSENNVIIRARAQQAKDRKVAAQAASWLLQTTSNRGDQVAAARFLRSIHRNAGATVFQGSGSWRPLLVLTRDALDVWESQPRDQNRELAEAFGLVLCSMPLPFLKDLLEGERGRVFDFRQQRTSGLGEAFLQTLELARAKNEGGDEVSIFHLALLSTFIRRDRMIKEYRWADLSKLFLFDANPRPLIADNLLGVWAYGAFLMSGGVGFKIQELEELMNLGENTEIFTELLSLAIWTSSYGLPSVRGHPQFELNASRAYFVCLRRARDLARKSSQIDLTYAAWGVGSLVLRYFDPMTASDSGHTPVELVKLSKEAVLGLRDFIDAKASKNGSSVVEISESEQLLNHHLVSVVADILMWDSDMVVSPDHTAESLQPSIMKILLWIWKNVSEVSINDNERRKIFLSSCRLWASLEKQVESARTGKFVRWAEPLTPDDLKRTTEFVDYIRKGRANSEFVSRNADVGINRLYLPFEQGVDWEYELFDLCEPRRLCCKSLYSESQLL